MDPLTAGAIVGGSQFLGGIANIISNYNTNKMNAAAIAKANLQNYAAQKEFYQNSIRWRKNDAIQAGINPIYALNASSATFTPSFQAAQETAGDYSFMGNAVSNAFSIKQAQEQINQQKKEFEAMQGVRESEKAKNMAQVAHFEALTKQINQSIVDKIGTGTGTGKGKTLNPQDKGLGKIQDGNYADLLPNEYRGLYSWTKAPEKTQAGLDIIKIAPTNQAELEWLQDGAGITGKSIKMQDLDRMLKPKGYEIDLTRSLADLAYIAVPIGHTLIDEAMKNNKSNLYDIYAPIIDYFKRKKRDYDYNTIKDLLKNENSPLIRARKNKGL